MHYESIVVVENFIRKYLNRDDKLKILDVGSRKAPHYKQLLLEGQTTDYIYFPEKRPLFTEGFTPNPNWSYTGSDLQEGENVDIVLKSPEDWGLTEQYDVIISGQCLEHVEDTHIWITQLVKYLKPNGLVCIVVPWKFSEHRCPIDCWRVFPDGMKFLLNKVARLEILEIYMYLDDTIGIARKI